MGSCSLATYGHPLTRSSLTVNRTGHQKCTLLGLRIEDVCCADMAEAKVPLRNEWKKVPHSGGERWSMTDRRTRIYCVSHRT